MTTDLLRSWPAARDDGLEEPAIENGGRRRCLAPDNSGRLAGGFTPGKLDLMHATVPTYYLYGIEAIPADVVVRPEDVLVVERGSGQVLVTQQARMQAGLAILGRRRSAPETMSTGQSSLSSPISPILRHRAAEPAMAAWHII
jgi:hypothetical protein